MTIRNRYAARIQNAATPQDMEQVEAAYKQARSAVDATEQNVKAADAAVQRAIASVDPSRAPASRSSIEVSST